MKLLFTDLDGVANRHQRHPDNPYCGIVPECMARLNRVIRATDCRLVITSAWRYMMLGDEPPMTTLGFEYMLRTHGLISYDPPIMVILGCTCSDEAFPTRGEQILRFLIGYHFNVESWAVVDDLIPLALGEHQHRLVRTDGDVGLTDTDADRLIELLGGQKCEKSS